MKSRVDSPIRSNILVSSSRQWNPGDEFILIGIQNLFSEATGIKHNWILYDRNPDLFEDGWRIPIHKERFWTNAFYQNSLTSFNLAVVAGTPEWFGDSHKKFYSLVKKFKMPLFILGVGYINAHIDFTDNEVYCLKYLAKLVVARDENASKSLSSIGIKHQILPCPALFASYHEKVPTKIKKIAFILQSTRTQNQNIPEELMYAGGASINTLREMGYFVEVICFYIDEVLDFEPNLSPIRYSYDAKDYIDILSEFDLIISTRLHGAILANSLGKPAITFYQDSRIVGAASLFPFILLTTPDRIISEVVNFDTSKARGVTLWKNKTKEQYIDLIKIALGKK